MNKWKISFLICLVVLIISNLFWMYSLLDSGVSQTYQQVTIDEQDQVINSLGELIVKGAKEYSKKDILYLLRKSKPNEFIVEDKNKIIFEGTEFLFKDDKLMKVSKY